MNITASLVPHSEFHLGSWLLPVKRPGWYYFMKKKNSHNNISNSRFMESVDGPLKELVSFLHRQGIKTTPSCSGHFRYKKDYENIYDLLEKDKDLIQKQALRLKDIETGKIYSYKNKNYTLPWTKKDFMLQVMDYQKKGVIGIRCGNRKKLKDEIMNLSLKGFQMIENDGLILIELFRKNEVANLLSWKMLTAEIKEIFRHNSTV